MASATVLNKLEKELECGVCLDKFREPKELSCQHSFCKRCLERLVTRNRITCPECRQETAVRGGDVAQLQSNRWLKKLLDLPIKDGPFCEEHKGEVIKVYCLTCDRVICRDCTVSDHREHRYELIAKVFTTEKEKLIGSVQRADAKIPVLSLAIESIENLEKKVQENLTNVRHDIDVFVEERIALLKNRRETLMQDLDRLSWPQRTRLYERKQSLSASLDRVKTRVDWASQILASENQAEVLLKKPEIIQQMAGLESIEVAHESHERTLYSLEGNTPVDGESVGNGAEVRETSEFILSMRGGEPGVLYTTRAHQTINFVITRNNCSEDDVDTIEVLIKLPIGRVQSPAVRISGDGTHWFCYRPLVTGKYKVYIRINGMRSCNSPLEWNVDQAFQLPKLASVIWRSVVAAGKDSCTLPFASEYSFEAGHHSWKTQIRDTDSIENLQIGVVHSGGSQVSYWEDGSSFSKVPPTIKSPSQRYDVFVCYLNLDKGQLIIYKERTNESAILSNLRPPVSPMFYPQRGSRFEFEF